MQGRSAPSQIRPREDLATLCWTALRKCAVILLDANTWLVTPRTEGRLKSPFRPSIQTGSDMDYLGAQGHWVCSAFAVLSFIFSVLTGPLFLARLPFVLFLGWSGRARAQPLCRCRSSGHVPHGRCVRRARRHPDAGISAAVLQPRGDLDRFALEARIGGSGASSTFKRDLD
jgi:hypothetical protein